MCPACLASAATIAAGITTTGAMAALAFVVRRTSAPANVQTEGDHHANAENREPR